jgi:hypothetical protein
MAEATWSLVAVTFLLALGAAWYAAETHRVVDRMDKEREARERPMLALHLVPWQGQLVKLRIQNVGPGAAFRISGAIEGRSESNSLSFPWSYELLAPGKYEEFGAPALEEDGSEGRHRLDKIRERFETIRAKFTYEAGMGKAYELDQTINVRTIANDWLEARMMATQDHPERLGPRIAKALDKIADSLSKLPGR